MVAQRADLPIRPFFYTIDQIAALLGLEQRRVEVVYVHYQGRTIAPHKPSQLFAINLAPEGEKPDWRVEEREFIRWLRNRKFKIYERAVMFTY